MTKSKAFFEPVESQVNFPEMESKLLSSWYKNGIVKKYLAKNKASKKYFSFQDGPITANNPMGVHHAWGRTYKDLWQRYKNMQGFKQRFQNGFDCQGLWVEVEVEKELGFKNKKDIESFGVSKFVQLCRDRVEKYSKIQTQQTQRLGNFMDWEHSYYTLSDDNNYMIWGFLKKCHEAGFIYKGADSVPWCPRCETAISQHEMLTEDYKELVHESVYLSFPIVGQDNEFLLVWTTTPWTVPANIAVAVDSDFEYSLIEVEDKKYWVAKDAVERVFSGVKYKLVKNTKGSKLVGMRYKGAFDNLPSVQEAGRDDNFHTVVPTDSQIMPITTTEGTGLVHTAVSAGIEDFKLGKKLGLPMIPIINDDASYMEGLGQFTGKNAKKNPRIILDYLDELSKEGSHFYYKIENYKHRYPACWRCKTELVWKVADEWYISMDTPSKKFDNPKTLRERMKDIVKNINWMPEFGLDREIDWLNNMHDWLISKKNRYWGLALPIWECKKCGNFEVIGSKDELNEKSLTGKLKGTPHKPQVDKIKIKCTKCGEVCERIEPVGNPWLDAGIVPFSTISENNKASNFKDNKVKPLYLTNKEEWKKWFPITFITESFPGQFKNWFYSLIAMATVMEDVEPFKNILGYGTLLAEDGRPMHKSWGNSIEFNEGADKIGADVMRFMFARTNPSENMLFGYKTADEVRRRFHLKLWNIYNFFVTYANIDGYKPSRNIKSQIASLKSVPLDHWIMSRLYKTIVEVTSYMDKYDVSNASGSIEKFVDDLSLWYIRRSRDRVGPMSENEKDRKNFYNTTYFVLVNLCKILAPITPFLSDLMYKNLTKDKSVHLADWPEMPKNSQIKQNLIDEMTKLRDIVEKAHAIRKEKMIPVKQPLQSFEVASEKLSKGLEQLLKDEINVKNVIWGSKTYKFDTKITNELKEEMETRDLVRKIQEERKNMGLTLAQKIDVNIPSIPKSKDLQKFIIRKAQVRNLTQGVFKVENV